MSHARAPQCHTAPLQDSATAQRPVPCALPAPRFQRASDLAAVAPARVKGIWQSSPSKPLPSPASDEFRLCLNHPRLPSHKVTYQRGSRCGRPFGPSTREPRARSAGPTLGLPLGRRPGTLEACTGAGARAPPGSQSPSAGTRPGANPAASGPLRRTPLRCGPSPDPRPGGCWPRTSTFSSLASNSPLFLSYLHAREQSPPPF